jgi:hypothetical protein
LDVFVNPHLRDVQSVSEGLKVSLAFSLEDQQDLALGGPEDRIVGWRIRQWDAHCIICLLESISTYGFTKFFNPQVSFALRIEGVISLSGRKEIESS